MHKDISCLWIYKDSGLNIPKREGYCVYIVCHYVSKGEGSSDLVTFKHAAVSFIPNVLCLPSSAQAPLLQFCEPRRWVLQCRRRTTNLVRKNWWIRANDYAYYSEELMDQGKWLRLCFCLMTPVLWKNWWIRANDYPIRFNPFCTNEFELCYLLSQFFLLWVMLPSLSIF